VSGSSERVKKSKTLLIFGKLRDEKCSYQLLQSNFEDYLTVHLPHEIK